MAQMVCPICQTQFARESSKSLPFCSSRCRQIDLGRWLNEEQRLPYVDLHADEEPDSERPGRGAQNYEGE